MPWGKRRKRGKNQKENPPTGGDVETCSNATPLEMPRTCSDILGGKPVVSMVVLYGWFVRLALFRVVLRAFNFLLLIQFDPKRRP